MNRIVIIHCTACHRHITAQIYKNICSILILSHSDFDGKSFFEHSFFFMRHYSLPPQALAHLASVTSLVNKPSLELRSSAEHFLFNRRTFLLNDSLHALRTDHRLQIKILSG